MPDRAYAKQIIREIIQAAGGKLAGKVRLHKAFYLAHLFYWQLYEGVLSDYPIVRMPFGPGIDDGPELILEMVQEGEVKLKPRRVGPFMEEVFHLSHRVKLDKRSPRYDAIRHAVVHVKKRTATQLSEETHEYSLSWQEASSGAELNIYLDMLTSEEYQRIKKASAQTADLVLAAFDSE